MRLLMMEPGTKMVSESIKEATQVENLFTVRRWIPYIIKHLANNSCESVLKNGMVGGVRQEDSMGQEDCDSNGESDEWDDASSKRQAGSIGQEKKRSKQQADRMEQEAPGESSKRRKR